jgi:hypothetical protein
MSKDPKPLEIIEDPCEICVNRGTSCIFCDGEKYSLEFDEKND